MSAARRMLCIDRAVESNGLRFGVIQSSIYELRDQAAYGVELAKKRGEQSLKEI